MNILGCLDHATSASIGSTVIAMTEIGEGSKATLQKGIASMGANTLMIFSGST